MDCPIIPICSSPGNAPCRHIGAVRSSCDPIVIYKTDPVIRTDQGSPFLADGTEKLLCPRLGPNTAGSLTSCWMKPSDPIPPNTHGKKLHSENTDPVQNAVGQVPSTNSDDPAAGTTFKSAFNSQSQPADYTAQEGTAGLPGILPAADQQNPAPYTPVAEASAEEPGTEFTTGQPNKLALNDFQTSDLGSLFPATG